MHVYCIQVKVQKIDWRREQEKARLHVLFVNVGESVRQHVREVYGVGTPYICRENNILQYNQIIF